MAWQAPHEVIEAQTGRLARRLVRAFAAEIPIYRRLPREELDGDITAITEHNLRVIAAMFRDDRPPTRAELAPLRDSAARRAQEGVPLESLLAAYHLGVRHVWEHLFAAAAPGDVDGVLAANRLILVYIEAVTAAVCTAYVEEREGMLSQEQHAMHATVAALLSGDLDALAGVRLAAAYQVLVLAIGPHPDERTSEIAGRRKVHRVRAALRRRSAEPVLSVLDPSGGTALIPGESDLAELGPALTKAADAPVWLAMESAAPADIPRAARLAGEVLEVARLYRRPPGAYRLADVLLEYQLTRPSEATRALAALLDPLNPDLLRTLKAYLDHGLDRRRTAELLHVHPNTVDYRIRRAVTLTGLDPVDPAALQRIGAALAARRLEARRRRPQP